MTPTRLAPVAAAALMATACGALTAEERPALIVRPTAQSRAGLARVITAALNGRAVTLADDALTRDSVLIVERREPRDAAGRPLTGRVLEMPERFRLVLRGGRCELVRERDGERWPLEAECEAVR